MDIKNSIVAILNNQNKIIGTGFIAAENLILTCAHVVEQATAGLNDNVTIRFSDNSKTETTVDRQSFSPSYEKDVALLRVNALPQGITPLPLGNSAGSAGHDFYAHGYAVVTGVQGIGARGKIVDIVDNGSLLQLTSQEPDHGMSGAPVLDEQRRVVIGMVTKGKGIIGEDESQRNIFTTFATSTEVIFEVCRDLKLSEICPYRSLDVFNEEDAPFFFGRERVTDKLLESLKREPRFLAVLGPSGSGKSSVVRAGLIPALRQGKVPGSQKWDIVTIRPANDPFEQLAGAGFINPQAGLGKSIRAWLEHHPDKTRLVLVIDQFEEVLVSTPADIRQKFIAKLAQLLDAPVPITLILTLRDDFYSRFLHDAVTLAGWVEQGLVNIPPTLEQSELRAMIIEPVKAAGLTFEDGLVDVILEDAAESDHVKGIAHNTILPLLEFALAQLWEKRQNGRLTHDSYHMIGGVTGGLAQWADQAFYFLEKDDRALARRILTELVHLGNPAQGLPDNLRRRALSDLYREPDDQERIDKIVHTLVGFRLLVTSMEDGQETIELIHDSLIQKWGLLNDWLRDDQEFLLWRQRNEDRLQAWLTSGDTLEQLDPEQLLRGHELAVALYWLNAQPDSLSNTEFYFISKSLSEQELQKERKKRQTNMIWLSLTMGLVIMTLLLLFSVWQLKVSRSNELASQSQSAFIAENFPLAGLYAFQANKIYNNYLATQILGKLPYENFPISRGLLGHTGGVTGVAWSPKGLLASASADGTIIVWDLATGQPAQTLRNYLTVSSLAWSPDGRLASSSVNSVDVVIWDLASGEPAQRLKAQINGVSTVAWSRDGRLASGSVDGTIIVWDIASGKPAQTLTMPKDSVKSISWSGDGRLASSYLLGSLIIWDLETGKPSQTLLGHVGIINSVAWSLDDRLASGAENGTIIIWDLAQGKPAQTLKEQPSVSSLAWSPDGRLASASSDKTVITWDLAAGKSSRVLKGHTSVVFSVAWSPDNRLASGSNDISVIIWDLSNPHSAKTLKGFESVQSVAWSPDGRLASGSLDGTVTIWDLETNRPARVLKGHTNAVNCVAWSSTGQLASGSADGTVIVWDIFSEKPAGILQGHSAYVYSLAWSPDGRLASGSSDGTVIIWDLASGKPAQTLKGHSNAVNGLAWSYTGQLASASWDTTIIIWDLLTGKPAQTLQGHANAVSSVAWSPDDRLASGSWDKTVIIWDISTGKPSRTFSLSDKVLNVAWSKKGYLAAALQNNFIGFWITPEDKSIQTLAGHTAPVASVAWDGDGRLASAASDGTIKIARADLISPEPCASIYRNLTVGEWISFVGVLFVYEPACPNLSHPKIDFKNEFSYLFISLYRPDLGDPKGSIENILKVMFITWPGRLILILLLVLVEYTLIDNLQNLIDYVVSKFKKVMNN